MRTQAISRVRLTVTAIAVGAGLAVTAGSAPVSASTVQSAGCPLLLCWLHGEAQAPTDPDIDARPDDVWTSECDGDICQSVPGFKDPGPGAPGGSWGPRW